MNDLIAVEKIAQWEEPNKFTRRRSNPPASE